MDHLLLLIPVGVVAIILSRDFWCWYFKINESNATNQALLREIQALRMEVHASRSAEPKPETKRSAKVSNIRLIR